MRSWSARVLKEEQRARAERHAQDERRASRRCALELGCVDEAALLKSLSAHYETHFVSTEQLAKAEIDKPALAMIPKRLAEKFGVCPVIFDPATAR